jgi:hypothetical protein
LYVIFAYLIILDKWVFDNVIALNSLWKYPNTSVNVINGLVFNNDKINFTCFLTLYEPFVLGKL